MKSFSFRPRRLAIATLLVCSGTMASVNTANRGKYRLYQLACQWYLLLVIVYSIWLHGENLGKSDAFHSGGCGIGLPQSRR